MKKLNNVYNKDAADDYSENNHDTMRLVKNNPSMCCTLDEVAHHN